jgi:negative regulator of sigma E activity
MRNRVWLMLTVCLFLAAPARADETKVILDRAIKAMGGADKLDTFQGATWKSKGTFQTENLKLEFTDEWSAQADGQYHWHFDVTLDGGMRTGTLVLNKDKGWYREDNVKTQDLDKEALALVLTDFRAVRIAERLTTLKDKAYQLAPLGELKIEDRAAVGIKVTHKDWPDLDLFFDKESGLPIRSELRFKESRDGQEVVHTFYFKDYKEVKGVMHFTTISLRRDDKPLMHLELTEVELHEKLDESTFDKP